MQKRLMLSRSKRMFWAISTACTSLIAGACYDRAQGITSTDSSIGIAAGTWRSTLWTLTDSGLTLLDARTGDLRQLNKQLVSGEGREVRLDVTNVAEMKASIMAEIAVGKMMNDVSFPSTVAPVPDSVTPKRKPVIRGGRTIDLGMSGGHRVSMQLSVEPRADKRPPSSALTLVDGRVVSMKRFKYRRQAKSWSVAEVTTTSLDSTGRVAAVTRTELNDNVGSTARASEYVKGGLVVLGSGLANLMLPDALHAATVSDDEEACTNERVFLAGAIAWEVGAAIGVATAAAACVGTLLGCLAYWGAHANWVAADLAVVGCWNALQTCLNPPPPKVIGDGGGGGGGGGNYSCWDVDWWISYDDGGTWTWLGTETQCAYAT